MAPLLPYSAGRSTWCRRKPLVGEVAPGSSTSEQPEGGGSVNGFFSKVARFAVSKMAAFCYAVAVGVAGNLIFHYVQTHEAVPSGRGHPSRSARARRQTARHCARRGDHRQT